VSIHLIHENGEFIVFLFSLFDCKNLLWPHVYYNNALNLNLEYVYHSHNSNALQACKSTTNYFTLVNVSVYEFSCDIIRLYQQNIFLGYGLVKSPITKYVPSIEHLLNLF